MYSLLVFRQKEFNFNHSHPTGPIPIKSSGIPYYPFLELLKLFCRKQTIAVINNGYFQLILVLTSAWFKQISNMKTITLKLNLVLGLVLIFLSSHSQTDVLMQHNDLNRTGWNPNETILNTSNVTPTNFGLLYKHTVDDQIFAQPLIITGVNVTDPLTHTQVTRNLLIVVTVKNTMYAFDADDGTLDPYWQINFTPPGEIPPIAIDIHASLCYFTYTDFKAAG